MSPLLPRAVAVALATVSCTVERSRTPEIGRPAPSYEALSLAGDTVALSDQTGKVVLLNVWATWCHPCLQEIPELKAVHARYANRGLELIGVSVDAAGNENGIREFMRQLDMTYPVWLDPDERISTTFLLPGIPATFLIDRGGVLRWRKTGPVVPGDTALTAAIERALRS